MDDTRFDGLAASLSGGASRRHIVRWLAVAAGGLMATAGLAGAEAKKKKKKKKKKKEKEKVKEETCEPGTRLASIDVPANGDKIFTPVLKDGQQFRLLAVGSWRTNNRDRNDACAAYRPLTRHDPIYEYEGVRLGLSVDNGSPDIWDTYNPSHLYEIEVTGRGKALSLHYTDPYPDDNSETLLVEVYCEKDN